MIKSRRDPVRFLQFVLRKAAHLFLYGMYGDGQFCPRNCAGTGHAWLGKIARRFPGARPGREGCHWGKGFGPAALLVALVAALDEHHQARIAGRSGRTEDVAPEPRGVAVPPAVRGSSSIAALVSEDRR